MKGLIILTFAALILIEFVAGEAALVPQTSRLCRQHGQNGVFRYHNQTRTCHQVGKQGPCRDTLIFYADPTSPDYGDCDCDISKRCNRHVLYWPRQNRCYFLYEQGPCSPNEWFTFGSNLEPTCEPNKCTSDMTEFDDFGEQRFWIHHRNSCVLTGTEGHCPLPNERLIFNGFSRHVHPFCSAVMFQCEIPEVPSLVCSPGQKWHQQNGCGLWDPTKIRHSPRIHGYNRNHHTHPRRNHHHQPGRENTTPSRVETTAVPFDPPHTTQRTPSIGRPDPLFNAEPRNKWAHRSRS